jgi:hypothetical protein
VVSGVVEAVVVDVAAACARDWEAVWAEVLGSETRWERSCWTMDWMLSWST